MKGFTLRKKVGTQIASTKLSWMKVIMLFQDRSFLLRYDKHKNGGGKLWVSL